MTHIQNLLLKILKRDKNTYIMGGQLIGHLYGQSDRGITLTPIELRREIKEIRKNGYPIIAGKKGYCFTTNEEEFLNYYNSRKAELKSEAIILNTMKGLG